MEDVEPFDHIASKIQAVGGWAGKIRMIIVDPTAVICGAPKPKRSYVSGRQALDEGRIG
jgi:hypothetical protein